MARDLDIVRRYCAMTPQDEAVLCSPAAPIGDLSDEPQCIGNDEARLKLAGIADYGLFHDRDIVNRIDDSVTRVTGREARVLRRDRPTVLDETECVFQLAPQGQNRRRRREALRQRNRRRCITTCSGLPVS
jgi:hydrogenase maturation factor HypF (carbamoyltransferase family)